MGWRATDATLTTDGPAHSGTKACKLCATAANGKMEIDVPVGAMRTGTLQDKFWIRNVAQVGGYLGVKIENRGFANGKEERSSSALVSVRSDYDELGGSSKYFEAVDTIRFGFLLPEAGSCILVDDVRLTYLP